MSGVRIAAFADAIARGESSHPRTGQHSSHSWPPRTETGATVYTDDHGAYRRMPRVNHETVRHGVGEYVDGQAHTNGVEIFALASRPEVVDSIQELARGRVGEWLTEFRDAIRALPEGRRQRYAEVRGLA